jgi:hypothetical protein
MSVVSEHCSADIGRRGGVLLDTILFLVGLGCVAYLLMHTSVLPASERAARKEREAHALEREVSALAGRVERLRRHVLALQSDPWYIERTLKSRLRELRPDLFPNAEPAAPERPGAAGVGGSGAPALLLGDLAPGLDDGQ